ncbi:RNA polymerase subunit sigma-70 [Actinocrispum wychmicini]|uniref:RNA polymerase sigma-70 factor (ECF subfamily) n=1 Tax=Actinocrispum wychmicini TaxID=1213861 RepID=A0A4R2JGX3_9PSEU|nr:RNA polymerase subunit sigma-70 [Actinocrispum wychmicini]TCO58294.1 RNA polymerase sigma-70 factor (ECF subfamily) [Actinocrispum wychmicini]
MNTPLLPAARAGDQDAFRQLLGPHLALLHVHCYRMLGSYHDAEEALQDVQLRAWRSLDTYAERAPLMHWLYRIATTTCLKIINARAKQPAAVADIDYLEPYPDRLLDALPDTDPAALAERRESVSLAFITALQLLPATQRAVLILREVLAWSAVEVADLLEATVPAVNSMLQRARATLRDTAPSPRPLTGADHRVLTRFIDAWHRRDIAGLTALLREDAELRMPPETMEFLGRDAVIGFFAAVPAEGRLETIRLVPTRANGQLAVAAFDTDESGAPRPYGLMVFDLDDNAVVRITGFPSCELSQNPRCAPSEVFTGLSPV